MVFSWFLLSVRLYNSAMVPRLCGWCSGVLGGYPYVDRIELFCQLLLFTNCCCDALVLQFSDFCKDRVISRISLLVALLISLRAIVNFSDRWAGGYMISSGHGLGIQSDALELFVMHLSKFFPTSPMQANQGIKFCPQGRGINLLNYISAYIYHYLNTQNSSYSL